MWRKTNKHQAFILIIVFVSILIFACRNTSNISNSVEPTQNPLEEDILEEITQDNSQNQEEETPTVEPTIAPTTDPYPVLKLPFRDEFDGGISQEWRIISGNPIVANGRLAAPDNKEINLEIGNNHLKNYTILTELHGKSEYGWGGYFSDLRFLFSPTFMAHIDYSDFGGDINWFSFEENEWSRILNTEFKAGDNGDTLKIVVNGNSYGVFFNGQLKSEIVYGPVREIGSPLIVNIEGDNIMLEYLYIE